MLTCNPGTADFFGNTIPNPLTPPELMSDAVRATLAAAIRRLLRPLVRILLRNGVPFGVFSDHAKQVYVEVAEQEFTLPGRKPSVSRVSVLTGLTRKEVSRLQREGDAAAAPVERYNRAARVISAWVREPRFHDASGRPASLPFEPESQAQEAGASSFSELVRLYGGDVPARAVLDELLRVEAVERTRRGNLRLRARAYLPRTGEEEKLAILGTDVADLVSSIDHNLTHPPEQAFFQRKVAYDNLVSESLPGIRRDAARRAQKLLEHLDRRMADQDRDTRPDVEGTGRHRAVLGIFYLEHEFDDDESGGAS